MATHYSMSVTSALHLSGQFIGMFKPWVQQQCSPAAAIQALWSQPRTQPTNTSCCLPCLQHWVSAFMREGGVPMHQVGHVEPPVYSPTSRTNSTLSISYSYDPKMTFNVTP